jgi:hypothetical protein
MLRAPPGPLSKPHPDESNRNEKFQIISYLDPRRQQLCRCGITVYTVACNLSDGVQANVFSFEQDAYLFLVDQAEGLTDAQRSELEELAKSQNRTLFWDLFNQSVSPVTSYRIESHTLELQRNLF